MSGIDEKGAMPLRGRVCVLLSGGMDSTVCLHWAMQKYRDVRAVGFDYGQPQRDSELVAAGKLARRYSIPFEMIVLADTLHSGFFKGIPEHDPQSTILHRAFVPARNVVFLSVALSRAARWWPDAVSDPGSRGKNTDITLVIGAVKDDADGFPDCRREFFYSCAKTLSLAIGRDVDVAAPYAGMTKEQMLADAKGRFGSSIADVQESWSCYAGKSACGICTPCVLRKRSFEAHAIDDLAVPAVMMGGDVGRERGFA